MMGLSDGQKTF